MSKVATTMPGPRSNLGPGTARRALRRTNSSKRAERLLALLFVGVPLIIFTAFVLVPFVQNFWYSFTDWNGIKEPVFIGLDNYIRMFTDERVYLALLRNFIWVVLGTLIPLVLGFVLAVMLWSRQGRLSQLLLAIYFLPFIMPSIVVAIVWSWIYNPVSGWANRLLNTQISWLGDPNLALLSTLVAAMWGAVGFVALIVSAGLTRVDISLVEAAMVDGAGPMRRMVSVILPQLAVTISTIATVLLVGGIGVFDIVYLMTAGGPGTSSEVLGVYNYKTSFLQFQPAYGAAISILLTALALPIALYINRPRKDLS